MDRTSKNSPIRRCLKGSNFFRAIGPGGYGICDCGPSRIRFLKDALFLSFLEAPLNNRFLKDVQGTGFSRIPNGTRSSRMPPRNRFLKQSIAKPCKQ